MNTIFYQFDIGQSLTKDHQSILAMYPEAFPDEDLTRLVIELLTHPEVYSLTARLGPTIVGHAAFTVCPVTGSDARIALLGPLCVMPEFQRKGLGGGLIEVGAQKLTDQGVHAITVLGDPNYYRRHGFDQTSSVATPYPLKPEWREAWRMRLLTADATPKGTVNVPTPWAKTPLWS